MGAPLRVRLSGCGCGCARAGVQAGRRSLATLLLEHEPLLGERVKLFLRMKAWEAALKCAVASGEADLLYQVVLHVKNRIVSDRADDDDEGTKVPACTLLLRSLSVSSPPSARHHATPPHSASMLQDCCPHCVQLHGCRRPAKRRRCSTWLESFPRPPLYF